MLHADCHCHTVFSRDCCTSLPALIARCERVGLGCLAVTDHNEIEGALRVRDRARFRVIVGEEIFTAEGEVIGLFLESRIPPRLPFRETLLRIKAQGGVVYLPHPISGIRRSQLSREVMEANADLLDVVERFNARNLLVAEHEARWLDGFIAAHGLAAGAASDAHSPWEIGNVRVELPDFDTPAAFVRALRGAVVTARRSPLWMRGVLNHRVRAALRAVQGRVG
jgi:predicted metal-dependent phosphoesterase TrpH